MKILFLHKWLIVGGVERILTNYCRLLSDVNNLKIDLLIAFEKDNAPFIEEIPDNINIYYIFNKFKTLKMEKESKERKSNLLNRFLFKIKRIKDKFFCKNSLSNIINNGNYDIIINFSSHFDPYLDFRNISIPIIRWQHLALDDGDSYFYKDVKYLRKYDKVVSICDEMATQIKDKANLSNEKLFTLYNPINFDIVVKKSLLEEIENDPPYFIQVARLDKIKRHCDLIEIYSRLVNLGVKENLYIVGNGEEYHNLKTQIEKLHLQDRCFLLGEIKNPYPYMKNAKLFLHTSEREGLPTVLLESLVLGIPVIAMNCKTGVQEILNYGKCGRIVEFGNKEKFIEDCLLLESDDLINSYKEEIPKHLSLFSEQSIKSSLIKLLESLSGELR